MNACPYLEPRECASVTEKWNQSYFSRPSPTAMMRLLSPSHWRSLLSGPTISHRMRVIKCREGAHIGPEIGRYSPFRTLSSPTISQMRTAKERGQCDSGVW